MDNCDQVTKINGVLERREIQCGVSQGSILGPLLFTVYINDLVSFVTQGNTYLYADGSAVVLTCPRDLEMNLNDAMKALDTWFCINKLSLNKYITTK